MIMSYKTLYHIYRNAVLSVIPEQLEGSSPRRARGRRSIKYRYPNRRLLDFPEESGESQLTNEKVFYEKRERTDARVSALIDTTGADRWSDAAGDLEASGHQPCDSDAMA